MITRSPAQTEALGLALGSLLQGRDLLCLAGDLGAGKTALARGLGKGWGTLQPLHSPTFVLIHEHRRAVDSLKLIHLDAYRLETPAAVESIGLEELLEGENVILLEWPERVEAWLPPDRLWIELEPLADDPDGSRKLTFQPQGQRYDNLLSVYQRHLAADPALSKQISLADEKEEPS